LRDRRQTAIPTNSRYAASIKNHLSNLFIQRRRGQHKTKIISIKVHHSYLIHPSLVRRINFPAEVDAPLPAHTGLRQTNIMPGQPGLPNLSAMRGRRKGGATTPQASSQQGIAALSTTYLNHLAARAYSQGSVDAHRWALRQFTAWADSLGTHDPTAFTRADLEGYQLFLHHYRSPRGGKPLVTNTQLARLGCIRRFFAWLCRSGVIPANPAADLDLPRKQTTQLPKALNPKSEVN
jgi:hypothetical protein